MRSRVQRSVLRTAVDLACLGSDVVVARGLASCGRGGNGSRPPPSPSSPAAAADSFILYKKKDHLFNMLFIVESTFKINQKKKISSTSSSFEIHSLSLHCSHHLSVNTLSQSSLFVHCQK